MHEVMELTDLKNQVALVTGASGDIGSAIAIALAERGAIVFIHYFSDLSGARKTLRKARAFNPRCDMIKANVADYEAVEAMISRIAGEHSRIDILVNCAGIISDRTIKKMEQNEWYQVINVNLNGTFNTTRLALPHMSANGNIINISSVASELFPFGQANYASAKAGVEAFTRVTAKELAKYNIRVNAIVPGAIETRTIRDLAPEIRQRIKEQIPMGRYGQVEHIVKTVFFILDNDYLAGALIKVAGGL